MTELGMRMSALSHPFPTPNLSGLRSQARVGWTLFFSLLWWLSRVDRCLLLPSQEVRQHLYTLQPRHSYICLRELVHTKHTLIDPSTKLSTFKQKLKFQYQKNTQEYSQVGSKFSFQYHTKEILFPFCQNSSNTLMLHLLTIGSMQPCRYIGAHDTRVIQLSVSMRDDLQVS